MTQHRPVILSGGKLKQLPNNDTIVGSVMDTHTAEIYTDFTHNNVVQGGYLGTAVSGGTFTQPASASTLYDGGKPGLATLRSSTTANSGYKIATADNALQLTGNGEYFRGHFNMTSASVNGFLRIGFFDGSAVTAPVDAVCVEFDRNTTTATFRTYSNTSTSSAVITTSFSPTAWYTIEIVVTSATSATATLYDEDGNVVGTPQTITANIPIGNSRNLGAGAQGTNSGTNAQDIATLDYMYTRINYAHRF